MAAKILVGTASWQEPDFIKFWYPKSLPKTKLLAHYAEHFSFVEVNGSFYGIPQATITRQWCEQTPDRFTFDLKLHRLLSRHATEARFLPPDLRPKADIVNGKVDLSAKLEKLVAKKFIAALEPLREAKKLGALLLQLSPVFSPRNNSISELDHVLSLFVDFAMAVELRNRHWMDPHQVDGTVRFFKDRNVTLVAVDTPVESQHFTVMPNTFFQTNPRLAYFRLHGRNEEAYVKGRTVQDRFNYDYSEEELIEFAQRIGSVSSEVEAVHVVFNNNREDFAPKAAAKLIKILEQLRLQVEEVCPRDPQQELL